MSGLFQVVPGLCDGKDSGIWALYHGTLGTCLGWTVGFRQWKDSEVVTLDATHWTFAGCPKYMSMYVIPVCMERLCDSMKWDM